jgi:hypothetical protein
MTPRKTATATVLAVAALLALTACNGGSTPSQSPTPSGTTTTSPTPSASASTNAPSMAPPTSEEEAKEQALAKAKEYWALEDKILKEDKGKNPERIDAVAMGLAAKSTRDYAKARAASPNSSSGARTLSPWGGHTSAITAGGKKYPHGAASLLVCNDLSKVFVTKPGGVKLPQPDPLRQVTSVDVVFVPAKGSWFVTKVSVPDPVVSC